MLGSHSPDLLLWRTVRLVVAFHLEIGLGRCLRLGDLNRSGRLRSLEVWIRKPPEGPPPGHVSSGWFLHPLASIALNFQWGQAVAAFKLNTDSIGNRHPKIRRASEVQAHCLKLFRREEADKTWKVIEPFHGVEFHHQLRHALWGYDSIPLPPFVAFGSWERIFVGLRRSGRERCAKRRVHGLSFGLERAFHGRECF